MAKTITCPKCGNRGEAHDDIHFEVRGQHQGRPVRKCLGCGVGLYVKMLGRAQVIPHDTWMRMQEIWEAEFGSDDEALDELPGLEEAYDAVLDGLPEDVPLALGACFIACLCETATSWPIAARGHASVGVVGADDWTTLEEQALQRVLRVALAPSLLLFLDDAQNRALLSEALDTRPSETVADAWRIYLSQVLTSEEAASVSDLPELHADENGFKFFSGATKALRSAAGFDPEMTGATEVLIFGEFFKGLATAIDERYWSMLKASVDS